MRVFIDNNCIGCEVCTELCPEVFVMRKDGRAEPAVKQLPFTSVDHWLIATDECPTSSILILEGSSF